MRMREFIYIVFLFCTLWDYNKFFSDCVLAVVMPFLLKFFFEDKQRPLIAFNAAVLQSLPVLILFPAICPALLPEYREKGINPPLCLTLEDSQPTIS